MAGRLPSAPGAPDAEIFEVRVTVESGRRGEPGGPRVGIRRWRRPLLASMFVLAAVVAVVLVSPWSHTRRPVSLSAQLREESAVAPHVESGPVVAAHLGGPPGVAAAYGYPQRCLNVTILGTDPNYARADFDHALPCGQYTGYATAIFHRVHGTWRVVINGVNYKCPVPGIPLRVQSALGVCESPGN